MKNVSKRSIGVALLGKKGVDVALLGSARDNRDGRGRSVRPFADRHHENGLWLRYLAMIRIEVDR
jgi:hypothetical protein